MDKSELEDLQDEKSWELDEETPASRPRKARAVVSVAFPREDFERVEEYAQSHRISISELIRQAALQRIAGSPTGNVVLKMGLVSVGGPPMMTAYFRDMQPSTIAGSASVETELIAAP